MDFLTNTTHMHITSWVLALVLFAVAVLAKKPNKVVHMVLRVVYILLIITGGALFLEWRDLITESGMVYDMKVLFGVLLIGSMEMVLVRKKKGKSLTVVTALFAIFLVVTLFLGLMNGIGFNF